MGDNPVTQFGQSIKIKYCPFCGGEARYAASGGDHWIFCVCGTSSPVFRSEEEAIVFWNKRYCKSQ